jgi:hypothetical protein
VSICIFYKTNIGHSVSIYTLCHRGSTVYSLLKHSSLTLCIKTGLKILEGTEVKIVRNHDVCSSSNQGDLESCVTWEVVWVCYVGVDCFWFHFCTVVCLLNGATYILILRLIGRDEYLVLPSMLNVYFFFPGVFLPSSTTQFIWKIDSYDNLFNTCTLWGS